MLAFGLAGRQNITAVPGPYTTSPTVSSITVVGTYIMKESKLNIYNKRGRDGIKVCIYTGKALFQHVFQTIELAIVCRCFKLGNLMNHSTTMVDISYGRIYGRVMGSITRQRHPYIESH